MFDKQLLSIPGVKKLIAKLSVLAVVQSIAIILEAVFLSQAMVLTWEQKKIAALTIPVLSFFVAFALRYLITRIENQITDKFASQASSQLKEQLLQKEFELGPAMVSNIGSGHMVTLALEGIDKVENYLNLILQKTINLAVIPWIILIYSFFVNWLSAVVMLLVFPVIILFMVILGLAAQAKSDRQYSGFKEMSNNFIDSMRGLKTLKLFGLSKRYGDNIYRVSENYRKSTMSVLKVALLSTFALDFFTTMSIAIVAVLLGVKLINGTVTLLPALIILILCPDYFLPVRDYGNDYHATLDGKNAMTDIHHILDLPSPTSQIKLHGFKNWTADSTLKVSDLNFSYDQKEDNISDANFNLKGFVNVGIVGRSGSGKSTLLNLLGGWLSPTNENGHLPFEVNGQKIDSLAQPEWQKHISYIPQDPYIFAGTIAQNIAFYKPDADMDAINAAIEKAGLERFVNSLPDKAATKIGEGGRGISGGQAQRIALARTLLDTQRTILLLDEPTAHLDIETEYQLKQTMVPIFKDHLVIFATHRLHWMNEMDYILVMEDGKIVEQGTQSELTKQNGAYKRLISEIRGDDNA
ncbi:thiol reductant ABC exporter subunit CydD [Fructilactobacillus fructivorans]|uniref:Transport ATP-binding protein CydD n=1 Tax=Fructilactobacillus fructivorans TaxID=1614 RepID=A0A0C1LZQ7_9LACO|nr:thiol reductant ABC exporter subunit CydD [Fructilactobacillus fructivorans]KID42360.1 Transport ATP-binding protein CydD [Fructilactobacillus fructivorans]MCT0151023.1 thiol reductant ABC exporter subunit CydD [Fructilactobacillus fructivorans]MCT2867419.1 thiol reductant ABC exporter subunit CydD [Fructilactobacillus fructivorans]MCT2869062.1 thiol reductant ABC exporter subunit CydD [Fructilactobacillus fructivorans]MCT2873218.1 thiol reductant ABC exporter subunit CydD [Fructilactobacil